MNTSLMTVVLESLAFFELGGDDVVDSDAAAEQLEGAVRTLGQLSPTEKAAFLSFVRSYADAEAAQKGPPERVEFFRSFADNFGLAG